MPPRPGPQRIRGERGAEMSRGERQEAAHQYADAGWPVFPCVPGEKLPATVHGFQDATTSHGQIERWWRRNPDRNVAIATGAPGPDVVDVDHHGQAGNGYAGWNKARRQGLVRDPAAIVRTPSGGMHAYFRGTGQRSAKIPAQHIDFRSQGGYVVAPPSAVVAGRRYEVVHHQPSAATVDFGAIRQLLEPEAARQQVQPAAGRPRDVGHLAGWVAQLSPDSHNRNDGLFWAANRAIEAGDNATLDAIAKAARSTGLDEREIDRTIRSALRSSGGLPVQREREAG